MMLDIFGEYGKPFYRFCDMMFLPKIDNQDWQEYITRRFSETGKAISPELAGKLADIVDNHPYYVQQLAQYTWLRTPRKCTEDIVQSAFQSMLDSLNLQFVNLMDSLTEKQRSFLCAICDGVRNFSSVETLSRDRLGTSGNIRIVRMPSNGASIDFDHTSGEIKASSYTVKDKKVVYGSGGCEMDIGTTSGNLIIDN